MKPYYDRYGVAVHHGDCLDVLASLPDSSVHAVVTDPPYGLEFMGKEWDKFGGGKHAAPGLGERSTEWVSNRGWNEMRCRSCGHLSHGGSPCRCATPDFARADDRWPRFQEWCTRWAAECLRVLTPGGHMLAFGGSRTWHRLAVAVEDAGFEIRDSMAWLYASGFPKSLNLDGDWQGWGTALKPAFEPIVVARKPLAGTVAVNVQEHGVGALNIDGCRIEAADSAHAAGRWPTNVVLTHAATSDGVDLCGDECVPGCPVAELDAQSGQSSGVRRSGEVRSTVTIGGRDVYSGGVAAVKQRHQDAGGASRFFPTFRFEAKAPTTERPRVDGVAHPTVKPLALMRWLVRLITPPGGTVLDPFLGSGTTAQAARAEGFRCIGVEREASYLPLIRSRLDGDGDDLFGGGAA